MYNMNRLHPSDAWRWLGSTTELAGLTRRFAGRRDFVLLFHSIGGIRGANYNPNVTVEQFDEIVGTLSERYQAVDLPELLVPSQDTRFAVTFDDGFRSVYTSAFRILRAYEVPATVYICPEFIGDQNCELLRSRHGLRESATDVMMTEEQVQQTVESELFTVGNHTATHADLADVDAERLIQEIVGGKQQLESDFDTEIERFSYPYGSMTEEAVDIVSQHHSIAVCSRRGLLTASPNRFRIPRLDGNRQASSLYLETTDYGEIVRSIGRRLLNRL